MCIGHGVTMGLHLAFAVSATWRKPEPGNLQQLRLSFNSWPVNLAGFVGGSLMFYVPTILIPLALGGHPQFYLLDLAFCKESARRGRRQFERATNSVYGHRSTTAQLNSPTSLEPSAQAYLLRTSIQRPMQNEGKLPRRRRRRRGRRRRRRRRMRRTRRRAQRWLAS